MTQPAVSRHLKVLERAGLISSGSDDPAAQRGPIRIFISCEHPVSSGARGMIAAAGPFVG
jgi:DNA-binding transcriptional ArsR family regulator